MSVLCLILSVSHGHDSNQSHGEKMLTSNASMQSLTEIQESTSLAKEGLEK